MPYNPHTARTRHYPQVNLETLTTVLIALIVASFLGLVALGVKVHDLEKKTSADRSTPSTSIQQPADPPTSEAIQAEDGSVFKVIRAAYRPSIPSYLLPIDPEEDLTQPTQVSPTVWKVSATAYCLTSRTANGERPVYRATAAGMKSLPMNSVWRLDVQHGPNSHRTAWHNQQLRINDRGAKIMQFDIAMPGRCAEARRWGRSTIYIERVG